MIVIAIFLFTHIVTAIDDYYYEIEHSPGCFDITNTTVPQKSCDTTMSCNCLLCSKDAAAGSNSSSILYCVFATNSTMMIGNTTWHCPDFTQHTVADCEAEKTRVAIVLGILFSICILACLIYTMKQVLNCVCDCFSSWRHWRNGFTRV